MIKTDILIIGGGAAGISAAISSKACYSEKNITIIRKEEKVLVPCGIPYIFGSLENSDKDIIPDTTLEKIGAKLLIDEVIDINRENKTCKTKNGKEISFEKLIFATGSIPVISKWLEGHTLNNVFTIPKNKVYLDDLLNKLTKFKNIVVIGGGFIGVEMSDELNKKNINITLIEILPHILTKVFDEEIAIMAEDKLKSRGVNIKCGVGVSKILGDDKVNGVLLNNGEKIDADAVILAMGYRPNTDLAKKVNMLLNDHGFIKVDEYMRSNDKDIFAVGDCAEKKDFITRRPSGLMLASIACAEARTAAMNLYRLHAIKTFSGTIGIFSTCIGNTCFGAAGITENYALKEGFDIISESFTGIDRHPGTLPDTHKQTIKLIVGKDSGIILGGEVVGGKSTGEIVNIIGLAIQNRMSICALMNMQIGTHPLLTGPPTAYPLIKTAEKIARQLNNR
jgi:NADH oxidase (H2O2-forming)